MQEEILMMLKELRPEYDFETSDNFIEDGYLDSFDIITLIDMMEEKYQVKVDGVDIIPENFMNVLAIAKLVQR